MVRSVRIIRVEEYYSSKRELQYRSENYNTRKILEGEKEMTLRDYGFGRGLRRERAILFSSLSRGTLAGSFLVENLDRPRLMRFNRNHESFGTSSLKKK